MGLAALPDVAEGLRKVLADEGGGPVRRREVKGERAAAALNKASAGSAGAGRVTGMAPHRICPTTVSIARQQKCSTNGTD